MSEELKPCPFCGGEDIDFASTNGKSFALVCRNCAARVGGRHYPDHVEQKEMIEKWNTRANMQEAIDVLEGEKIPTGNHEYHDSIIDKLIKALREKL